MTQQIFTTSEAAKLLGCSPRAITIFCDGGKMHSYRVPGSQKRRITRAQIDAFVANCDCDTPEDFATYWAERMRPLTPTVAEAAYDAAPSIPISPEEIERIVSYVVSGNPVDAPFHCDQCGKACREEDAFGARGNDEVLFCSSDCAATWEDNQLESFYDTMQY